MSGSNGNQNDIGVQNHNQSPDILDSQPTVEVIDLRSPLVQRLNPVTRPNSPRRYAPDVIIVNGVNTSPRGDPRALPVRTARNTTGENNAFVDISSLWTRPAPTVIAFVNLCSPVEQRRLVVRRSSSSRSGRAAPMPAPMPAPMTAPMPAPMPTPMPAPVPEADRQQPPSESIGAVTTAAQSRESDILDESANENVPKVNCSICFEAALKNKPTITKCGHVFCNKCISKWLASNRTCPLCKTKLTLKSLVRMYL